MLDMGKIEKTVPKAGNTQVLQNCDGNVPGRVCCLAPSRLGAQTIPRPRAGFLVEGPGVGPFLNLFLLLSLFRLNSLESLFSGFREANLTGRFKHPSHFQSVLTPNV